MTKPTKPAKKPKPARPLPSVVPAEFAHHAAAAVWMPPAKLAGWEGNPNVGNDAAVARSIERFGFVAPVCVWTSKMRIVAGHTRCRALALLLEAQEGFVPRGAPGPGLVPVRFHEFESEAEADAYALADNQLERLATTDDVKLAAALERIRAKDASLPKILGFDDFALEAIRARARLVQFTANGGGEGDEDEDEIEIEDFETGDGVPCPFPWFGGKSRAAPVIWARFGKVANYVEPFFGSGAVLFQRPDCRETGEKETVNDLDGFVANFWRACKLSPDLVAEHADNPVNENDLHARHVWLVKQREELSSRLNGDPDWHDAKIAGWWVWGISCWIGSGFCSGKGPWWPDAEGKLVHLGDDGQGVNRQRVHLAGDGRGRLVPWFQAIADRLRRVRVCSGDWKRVCGPSVTFKHGLTAVLLDPPYADTAKRASDLYRVDSESVAHDVRAWAIENGKRPDMRIALCGYEGEHEMPRDWTAQKWRPRKGYAAQAGDRSDNRRKERIWFSPACLPLVAAPPLARPEPKNTGNSPRPKPAPPAVLASPRRGKQGKNKRARDRDPGKAPPGVRAP